MSGRLWGAALVVVSGIALALAVPFAATADTVTNTIAVDSAATTSSGVVGSPDGARLYVSDQLAGTVSIIDTATNAVTGSVPVSNPLGLAISPDGSRLYAVSTTTASLVVIDTATAGVVATVPVGSGPIAVAVSPDGTRAYVTSVNGTFTSPVTVVDTATNTVVTSIPVAVGPRAIIVSPDGSRLYVAHSTPTSHDISVISTATNTVIATIPVGVFANRVDGFAFSADGSTVYAVSSGIDSVQRIDTATNTITVLPAGDGAYDVALTPDGTRVYVTDSVAGTVSVIETATGTVVSTVAVGTTPRSITISPDGAFAYVANIGSDTVSVIAIDTFPKIVTTTLPGGTITSAYSSTISVSGTPTPTLALTSGTLPPGLTLTGDTISGTPTAPGSYTFTLTASSSVSGIASTVSQPYTLVVSALVPDAPLTLSATPDTGTAVLNWTAPASDGGAAITGYRIERSSDGGAFTTLVSDTASAALTRTDATVTAGHTYQYRVSALNSAGVSAPSNTATVVFPAAAGPGGATPTGGATSSPATTAALADTGSDVTGQLLVGLGLLVAGAAAWTARRRTRQA